MCTEVSISAFSNSAGMSSGPAALLFFSDLIAFLILFQLEVRSLCQVLGPKVVMLGGSLEGVY